MRTRDAAIALAIGLVYLAALQFGVVGMSSDGFYYLVAARNFVEQGVFTYDTIHTTNGFHWGWMVVLLALCKVFSWLPGDPLASTSLVHATLVANVVFAAIAGAAFARLLAKAFPDMPRGSPLLLSLLIFLDPLVVQTFVGGLETALFLLLLIAVANELQSRRLVRACVLAQLLAVTRIEGIVVFPILAWHAWRSRAASRARDLVLVFPWALVLVPALNVLADGTLASNSSVAKAYWSHLNRELFFDPASFARKAVLAASDLAHLPTSLQTAFATMARSSPVPTAVALLAFVLFLAIGITRLIARRGSLRHARGPGLIVWYAALTFAAYKVLLFTPRGAGIELVGVYDYQSRWYFLPHSLILLGVSYGALRASVRSRVGGVAIQLALFVALWLVVLPRIWRATPNEESSCVEPPREAVYLSNDDNGHAYFRRLKLVVADGLVTGRNRSTGEHYTDALRGGSAGAYLLSLDPTYVNPALIRMLRASGGIDLPHASEVELCGIGSWLKVREPESTTAAQGRWNARAAIAFMRATS